MKFRLVEDKEKKFTVYHGSKKSFNEFDMSKIGDNISTDEFDIKGVYFTPSKEVALEYAYGESNGGYEDDNGVVHEYTSPATEFGFLYVCKLFPKRVKIINTSTENEFFIKNQDRLHGYDLVIVRSTVFNKSVNSEDEYIVLDTSIIKIVKRIKVRNPDWKK